MPALAKNNLNLAQQAVSRAAEFLTNDIEQRVNGTGDPDLAKAVLWQAERCFDGYYLELLPGCVDAPKKDVAVMVSKLVDAGLVTLTSEEPRFVQVRLAEGVKDYLRSEKPHGPYVLFEKKGVSPELTLKAMLNLTDFARFSYSRAFVFPKEALAELKAQSLEALKPIREKEKKYIHEMCNVPPEFEVTTTLVREPDPEYALSRARYSAKFQTPVHAFKTGFDCAYGRPLSSKPLLIEGKTIDSFPSVILIEKPDQQGDEPANVFDIKFVNLFHTPPVQASGLPVHLEAKRIMPILKDRLESVLG